jgi:hypothetical protein
VDSHHDVSNQFDFLTEALEDPGTDLHTVLAVLLDDLRAAIPAALGLTVTITEAGDAVTLTSTEPDVPAAAAASLHVPFDELTAAATCGTVTFYAARPGAFVDLAADIRFGYGLGGQVVIDGHLDDPLRTAGHPGGTGVAGLEEMVVANRAIGVLIAQGHHPDTARSVLQRRADRAGTTLSAAAQHLLDELASSIEGPIRSKA